jgi:hypothetical protein
MTHREFNLIYFSYRIGGVVQSQAFDLTIRHAGDLNLA